MSLTSAAAADVGSPLELSRVHWVKPQLMHEVRFLSRMSDGLLRQVAYEGLRDKPGRL